MTPPEPVEARDLTAAERDELELLRRNRDEDTPGPWIQRAFDALATAQGNAGRVEALEAEVAALRADTARVPEALAVVRAAAAVVAHGMDKQGAISPVEWQASHDLRAALAAFDEAATRSLP